MYMAFSYLILINYVLLGFLNMVRKNYVLKFNDLGKKKLTVRNLDFEYEGELDDKNNACGQGVATNMLGS